MDFREIKIKYTPELAEIMGIMLGDGSFFLDKKRGKYHTTICFNKNETDYLEYVKRLFAIYFKSYKFCKLDNKSGFFLRNVSVFVGKQLIKTGLKLGSKVKNKVTIPQWILNNKN